MAAPVSHIVKKFIQENKHKYPNLTEQQLVDICETPFRYMKEVFRMDSLPEYRLKYLGTFRARPSNLNSALHKLNVQLEKGVITQETFDEKVKPILDKKKYYEQNPY